MADILDSALPSEVLISLDGNLANLCGYLTIPPSPRGIVIFGHGSGSGRNSPRNQYVAKALIRAGFATALIDLLTEDEANEDEKTKKLRFDIELLAERLTKITEWVLEREGIAGLKIGYFGASTGASAALIAAAKFGEKIRAIVSRGGRVDLTASTSLKKIHINTSILLLIGSNDLPTISWNDKVMRQLKHIKNKRMVLVQGAGHLFDEEGKLAEVAKHAASWFELHL